MTALTFRGVPGAVFITDGPRDVSLTEKQCDQLLDILENTEAAVTYNRLYSACQEAGFIPRCTTLRLVQDDRERALAQPIVRAAFIASVASLRGDGALPVPSPNHRALEADTFKTGA